MNSIKFDDIYAKSDKGYWQSNAEMFARAFACYVSDKVRDFGGRTDYQSGHSELALSVDPEGKIICAIPQGEERTNINKQFDKLISVLKEKEILHEFDYDNFELHIIESKIEKDSHATDKNAEAGGGKEKLESVIEEAQKSMKMKLKPVKIGKNIEQMSFDF